MVEPKIRSRVIRYPAVFDAGERRSICFIAECVALRLSQDLVNNISQSNSRRPLQPIDQVRYTKILPRKTNVLFGGEAGVCRDLNWARSADMRPKEAPATARIALSHHLSLRSDKPGVSIDITIYTESERFLVLTLTAVSSSSHSPMLMLCQRH